MFRELMPLLKERTIMLTLSQIDDATLRVCVIPKRVKEDAKEDTSETAQCTPLMVTGNVDELERDFSTELSRYTTSMITLGSNLRRSRQNTAPLSRQSRRRRRRSSTGSVGRPRKRVRHQVSPGRSLRMASLSLGQATERAVRLRRRLPRQGGEQGASGAATCGYGRDTSRGRSGRRACQ